jgi:hypothetical protein
MAFHLLSFPLPSLLPSLLLFSFLHYTLLRFPSLHSSSLLFSFLSFLPPALDAAAVKVEDLGRGRVAGHDVYDEVRERLKKFCRVRGAGTGGMWGTPS